MSFRNLRRSLTFEVNRPFLSNTNNSRSALGSSDPNSLSGRLHFWSAGPGQLFFACLTPKSGSTQWNYFLRTLFQNQSINSSSKHTGAPTSAGSMPLRRRPNLPSMTELSPTNPLHQAELEVRALLQDRHCFRFAIVRHPWRRLLSAFRDKVGACHYERDCVSRR